MVDFISVVERRCAGVNRIKRGIGQYLIRFGVVGFISIVGRGCAGGDRTERGIGAAVRGVRVGVVVRRVHVVRLGVSLVGIVNGVMRGGVVRGWGVVLMVR